MAVVAEAAIRESVAGAATAVVDRAVAVVATSTVVIVAATDSAADVVVSSPRRLLKSMRSRLSVGHNDHTSPKATVVSQRSLYPWFYKVILSGI